MKKLFLILLVACQYQVFAQTNHKIIGYEGEKVKDIEPYLNTYKKELRLKYNSLFENQEWLNDYINDLIEGERRMNSWGIIYNNWQEANDYLNKLIKQILQDKWSEKNEVAIRRDPEMNAFMIENGKIYINVGMLANISSEAELASIIGHEYGHFANQHSYKGFLNYKRSVGKAKTAAIINYPGALLVAKRAEYNYFAQSRENESEADNIELAVLKASRYSMFGSVNSFKKFLHEEKKHKREIGFKIQNYYSTHPPTENRLLLAEKEAKKTDTLGRKDFLVNEPLFNKIKQQAIDECIFLHLKDFEFKEAMEKAYKQLLSNPNDEFYMFYLEESIRRYLMINPEKKETNFLTDHYQIYDRNIPKETWPKVSLSKNLKFSSYELNKIVQYNHEFILFNNDKKDIEKINKTFLTQNDTIEFVSNNEALDFFIKHQEYLKQNSAGFIKFMLGIDTSKNEISSNNTDINKYNAVFNQKRDANDTLITILPLRIKFEDDEFAFWDSKVNSQTFFSDVIMALEPKVRIPYRLAVIHNIVIQDKVMLYDLMTSLQSLGPKTKEMENYYKDARRNREDIYKSLPLKVSSLYPETAPYLKQNKMSRIVFFDISVAEDQKPAISVQAGPFGIPFPMDKKVIALKAYYFDADKDQFCSVFHVKKEVKSKDVHQEVAIQMLQVANKLISDAKNNRKTTEK